MTDDDYIEWPKSHGYPAYHHADYLNVLQPEIMRERVVRCVDDIRTKKNTPEFDTIAFTGSSGLLIAPQVALLMGKQMIMVRKEEENRHSPYLVEGFAQCKKYIILDDCSCSGSTIRRVIETMKVCYPFSAARCVGVYLYLEHRFYVGDELRWVVGKDFYNKHLFYSDDKIAAAVAESDDPTVAPYVGVIMGKDGPVSAPFGGPDNLPFAWLPSGCADNSSNVPDGDDASPFAPPESP